MKCHHLEARDLPDAWFQSVDLCYKAGRDYTITEGSYVGQQRKELDYVTIHISQPQTRPLLPQIPPHFCIPDPVEPDYLDQYLPYIMTDHKEPGEQYTYGERLFGKLSSFDSQVEEVIAKFKRGFGNNQATMTVARPEDIHLTDPPCLRSIDCRVFKKTERYLLNLPTDEEKLHFYIYFRSNDLWSGFPANLAAIALLQEYMANEIGIEPGEFIYASKGLHLYDHAWSLAKMRLGV